MAMEEAVGCSITGFAAVVFFVLCMGWFVILPVIGLLWCCGVL